MSSRGISNWGKGKTKQSPENEANINKIVKRNIQVEQQELDLSRYMDVSEFPTDLQTCFQRSIDATEMFQQLPAEIRLKMMNDPANLEIYVSRPENWPELERLGILKLTKAQQEKVAQAAKQEESGSSEPPAA